MSTNLPRIASHEEWLAARKELLAKEKELTRARDALSAQRRRLPMVEIDQALRASRARRAEWAWPTCSRAAASSSSATSCSTPSGTTAARAARAGAEEMSAGHIAHLNARDTTMAYVSRAPLESIEDYKRRRGWTFPWYSSYGSDFNYDFGVTLDPSGRAARVQLPPPIRGVGGMVRAAARCPA